jgi:hypothetical protein
VVMRTSVGWLPPGAMGKEGGWERGREGGSRKQEGMDLDSTSVA